MKPSSMATSVSVLMPGDDLVELGLRVADRDAVDERRQVRRQQRIERLVGDAGVELLILRRLLEQPALGPRLGSNVAIAVPGSKPGPPRFFSSSVEIDSGQPKASGPPRPMSFGDRPDADVVDAVVDERLAGADVRRRVEDAVGVRVSRRPGWARCSG